MHRTLRSGTHSYRADMNPVRVCDAFSAIVINVGNEVRITSMSNRGVIVLAGYLQTYPCNSVKRIFMPSINQTLCIKPTTGVIEQKQIHRLCLWRWKTCFSDGNANNYSPVQILTLLTWAIDPNASFDPNKFCSQSIKQYLKCLTQPWWS